MRVARTGRRHGVLVSKTMSVIHHCTQVLMILKGFYLITTDILGPYGVGFAMGTLGWGPGERDAHAH
jgi:hypothetical protein